PPLVSATRRWLGTRSGSGARISVSAARDASSLSANWCLSRRSSRNRGNVSPPMFSPCSRKAMPAPYASGKAPLPHHDVWARTFMPASAAFADDTQIRGPGGIDGQINHVAAMGHRIHDFRERPDGMDDIFIPILNIVV